MMEERFVVWVAHENVANSIKNDVEFPYNGCLLFLLHYLLCTRVHDVHI